MESYPSGCPSFFVIALKLRYSFRERSTPGSDGQLANGRATSPAESFFALVRQNRTPLAFYHNSDSLLKAPLFIARMI